MLLPANVNLDAWLTEALGKPSYGLRLDQNFVAQASIAGTPEAAWVHLLRQTRCFAFAKVPTEHPGDVHFLEDRGFHLVDTNVSFDKPVDAEAWSIDACQGYEVRLAEPADREATMQLARAAFVFTRFHLDPQVPERVADDLKARWVEGFFLGKRGESMVLALADGEVVGFLQLLRPDDRRFVIDLIAVHEGYRRRRIAWQLIHFAEKHYAALRTVLVGTQVANAPSVRLYEKMGFRLANSSYVLHFHG